MTTPEPDLAFQLADALLGHILARLTAVDAVPARAFVCGEDTIPSDDCCKGLVWTRTATILPTLGDTTPDNVVRMAGLPIPGHVILLEAGHLRCAPVFDTRGGGRGKPPKPEAYTLSALASARDRKAVREAIECDLPDNIDALGADGQVVGAWLPLWTGDCAGGYITTQIVTTLTH